MKSAVISIKDPKHFVNLEPKDVDRFWSFVERRSANECWIWSGCKDKDGYGIFQVSRRARRAHRLSWILEHGSVPKGCSICHKCDVPSCVNPNHLFHGTTKDNQRDCVLKGRKPKGETHGAAALTNDDVREIRRLRLGGAKRIDLAVKFGCTVYNISKITTRFTWRHVV